MEIFCRSDWLTSLFLTSTREALLFGFYLELLNKVPFKESIFLKNKHVWKADCWMIIFLPLRGQVQFSHSVVSNSLRPHEPQHARPPCPSPIPRVYPNSCLSSRWCHPTTSSSVVPFSCRQSFPASWSLQISQLFASGGQSIGVSASTSVLPVNTQDWSPLG